MKSKLIIRWTILLSFLGQTFAIEKKPNVLIILADDVGTEDVVGYWGNNIVDMPNLQKLQDKGVTFMDAHSSPKCAPSRYMLLSGNYHHRGTKVYGSWGFEDKQSQFRKRQRSIAHMLQSIGYKTGMLGKWHIGAGVPGEYNGRNMLSCCNLNWTKPVTGGPNDLGFDESFFSMQGLREPYAFFEDGYLTTKEEDIVFYEKGSTWETANQNGLSMVDKNCDGDRNWDSSQYDMDLVIKAEDFIERHTASEDPFFLYLALGMVHEPHSPPIKYHDGTPIAGTYATSHLDKLWEMDKIIGSIVTKLEETNEIQNTIIIFTSDNGGLRMGYRNKFLRSAKGSLYEGGHRVPFVMRYDGVIPAGEKRDSHYISLADVYATLSEMIGFNIPSQSAQDSFSFASYAKSERNTSGLRRYLPEWDFINIPKKGHILSGDSIRMGDFKYIRKLRDKNGNLLQKPRESLYNLKGDIQEKSNLLRNVFINKRYEEMKKKMKTQLRRLGQCPYDKDNAMSFELRGGLREGETVNCDWFRTKRRKRCNFQIVGELYCNSLCGRFRDQCSAYDRTEL